MLKHIYVFQMGGIILSTVFSEAMMTVIYEHKYYILKIRYECNILCWGLDMKTIFYIDDQIWTQYSMLMIRYDHNVLCWRSDMNTIFDTDERYKQNILCWLIVITEDELQCSMYHLNKTAQKIKCNISTSNTAFKTNVCCWNRSKGE